MARAKRVQKKAGARLPESDPEIMSSDSEELVLHNDDDQDESDMESLEEAVFDLDGGSEDESDEDDEHEANERYKALAKQARALEAKMRVARGEEEESSSEEEDEEKAVERWGKKGAYYAADNVDLEGSEEEDALQDEEEEALRLQKATLAGLSAQDYGALPGDEEEKSASSEEEEEEEEHLASDEEQVEFVPRDIEGLTEEERKAAVARAAPELAGLLTELRASLAEVRHRVGPLLEEVKQGGLATAEGVSYLEAKHLLLLQYCASIVFYFLLKAEGRRVAGHPVVARLVEIKSYLEKIRPIDKRLKHQVDKLLQAATNAAAAPALAAAPRPEALLAEDAARAEEDRRMLQELGEDDGINLEETHGAQQRPDGVYRPPRIAPTSMELEKEGKAEARAAREALHRAKRAKRSGLMSELAAEMEGRPEELRETLAGMDTAEAVRMRNRENARAAVEEELFVRIPLGRDELKAQRAAQRAGLAGAALLDDFHQDMAGILDVGEYGRHRTAQRWGGEANNNLGGESRRSGDADLPAREPLAERRAKYDSLAARRDMITADNNQRGKKSKLAREEDEFYREVKAAKKESKEKRTAAYRREDPQPPGEETQAPGARAINRAIEKNRGLTPNKGKAHANPRTVRRHKFDRATTRRRSAVQEVTPGAAGMYGGEKTGIKARLTKSTKLG